jgi:hypothetical protein
MFVPKPGLKMKVSLPGPLERNVGRARTGGIRAQAPALLCCYFSRLKCRFYSIRSPLMFTAEVNVEADRYCDMAHRDDAAIIDPLLSLHFGANVGGSLRDAAILILWAHKKRPLSTEWEGTSRNRVQGGDIGCRPKQQELPYRPRKITSGSAAFVADPICPPSSWRPLLMN